MGIVFAVMVFSATLAILGPTLLILSTPMTLLLIAGVTLNAGLPPIFGALIGCALYKRNHATRLAPEDTTSSLYRKIKATPESEISFEGEENLVPTASDRSDVQVPEVIYDDYSPSIALKNNI